MAFSLSESTDGVRQCVELNNTISNSDRLPLRVLPIYLFLLILGGAFAEMKLVAGWAMIVVAFCANCTQCFYGVKIHRLGAWFKNSGSKWEDTEKSPMVGIFATGLLLVNLLFLYVGLQLWAHAENGKLSEVFTSEPMHILTLGMIVATPLLMIVYPFISRIESRYNHS